MKLIGMSMVVALCAVAGCKKKSAEVKAEPAPAAKPVADPAPVAAPPAAAPTPPAKPTKVVTAATMKLDVPDDWERGDDGDGGKLETFVAVNDSKFPVDNATFLFTFNAAPAGAPTDPAKFGEWHALEMKTKVDKTEVIGDAHYYAFAGPRGAKDDDKYWLVVKKVGDGLWQCGGSLYKDADYNKIPKVRDQVLAAAKKICASMVDPPGI